MKPRAYLRFSANERVQHWLLAVSFFTLVVTGLALKFGWSVPWVDGQMWAVARSALHRYAAVVFIALAAYHAGYLGLTVRGRAAAKAMIPHVRRPLDALCFLACCLRLGPPSTSDWRDLVQMTRYNLGLTDRRPEFGRFTYAEKMEYLALVWGTAVMIVTGLSLWFAESLLNRLPFWALELATTIHYYEAILATLAIFVWHFYFNIYNPDVFPLSRTMITGEMDREEMEKEHGLELRVLETRAEAPRDAL